MPPENTRPADPRHVLGRRGEQLAVEHLERCGLAIVARNHRTRYGELDVVADDGRALVFVEVKTRRVPGRAGSPLEAFSPAKVGQVRRMAAAYLAEVADRPRRRQLRFDAIGVTVDAAGRLVRLEHLEGAF